VPSDENTDPVWRPSDRERLLLVERNVKQLLRDHNVIVQAVEQLEKMVRALEDYKLTVTTRIDTVVTLLKLIGLANILNILAMIVFRYWVK
jgi:Mg/Co/Ni transporter MgtE